jgi:hypothetical protein
VWLVVTGSRLPGTTKYTKHTNRSEQTETRPVGRVILDFGLWIWDFVFVSFLWSEEAETRPVGRVTLDFRFWILDFVSFSVIRVVSGYRISANGNRSEQAETRPVGRVTLDFGFWDFVLFSVIRVVRGYRISANENHKTH